MDFPWWKIHRHHFNIMKWRLQSALQTVTLDPARSHQAHHYQKQWRRKIVSNSEMRKKRTHTHFIYMRRCKLWASWCAHIYWAACLSTKLLTAIISKYFQQFPFHIATVTMRTLEELFTSHEKCSSQWSGAQFVFGVFLLCVVFTEWKAKQQKVLFEWLF